ncbi:hypothetical protein [Methanosarcina siciliae]|nr:hypothetical protein [Methanosarcina siciliae]
MKRPDSAEALIAPHTLLKRVENHDSADGTPPRNKDYHLFNR